MREAECRFKALQDQEKPFVITGKCRDSQALVTHPAFKWQAEVPESFQVGTIFTLMNYIGTWNGGLFVRGENELENGEEFLAGQNRWRITYDATEGGLNFTEDYLSGESSRFVIITATGVPEPSSALVGALGGLLLLRRKRNNKKA
jgi:hypothetical protein